jgi:hypothetical protein
VAVVEVCPIAEVDESMSTVHSALKPKTTRANLVERARNMVLL